MTEMIFCGVSMEMRAAKELGHIGKCIGCLHCIYYSPDRIICSEKGILDKEKENCNEWFVDYR